MSIDRYDAGRNEQVRSASDTLKAAFGDQRAVAAKILSSLGDTVVAAEEAAGKAKVEADKARAAQTAGRNIEATAHQKAAEDQLSIALAYSPALLSAKRGDIETEWKECRSTIDRFDKLLVDLRKTGFGLVTVLVTAAATLQAKGILGTSASEGQPQQAAYEGLLYLSAFGAFALLIVTLFIIDTVHAVWLKSAVDRAQDIERHLQFQLTQKISGSTKNGLAPLVGPFLYAVLLTITALVFWIALSPPDQFLSFTSDPYRIALGAIWIGTALVGGLTAARLKARRAPR